MAMGKVLLFLAMLALASAQPCDVLDPTSIEKYVQHLPILARSVPNGTTVFDNKTMPHYIMDMIPTSHTFHPSLGPATVYSYNGNSPGALFDVEKDSDLFVSWNNKLSSELSGHILPVDMSLVSDDQKDLGVYAVTHLHGSHSLAEYDGLPEDYVAFNKTYPAYYDNTMNSTMIWYHDHALGITRLNAYAGLTGPYIIRDELERSLNLPNGSYEVALILQDRALCEDGSLYYPTSPHDPYEEEMDEAFPKRHRMNLDRRTTTDPEPNPSVIAEFFGNLIDVNGAVWPQFDVERRTYRFRVLVATNARTFILQFEDSHGNAHPFTLIGTDGGLLPKPIEMTELRMMGAERADILVDFAKFPGGAELFLKNYGPDIPWQSDPDYDAADPETTGQVMRFNVKPSIPVETKLDWSAVPPQPNYCDVQVPAQNVFRVDLYENYDVWGRNWLQIDNLTYGMPVTNNIPINEVVWFEFINHSEDAHPMHLHQIEYTVCGRENVETGEKLAPFERESGLKDTVEASPGYLTRIATVFDIAGKYVMHCHMLEHEDYDMMRPILIQ